MNSFDDELSRQLASLDTELTHTGLPGAAAARERGTQRTRHQLTAAALGTAIVIAVGALGIVEVNPTTAPAPATTPGETVTPDGTPSSPAETPLTVPAGALLTTEDLPGSETIDWVQATAPQPFECAPSAPEGAASVSFVNSAESNGHIDQFIAAVEPGRAEAELDELSGAITDCVGSGGSDFRLDEVWSVGGIGDETWLARYWAPPTTSDTQTLVTVSITRTGDYVSTVFQGGPAQDANLPSDPALATTAAERLCSALGQACTGDLTRDRLYPEAAGDVAGWLTTADVMAATGDDSLSEGGEPRPYEDMGWAHAALSVDPVADGATSVEARTYFSPLAPDGPTVDEIVARFPDASAARSHYDDLLASAVAFTADGAVVKVVGTVDADGYAGTVWALSYPDGYLSLFGVVTGGAGVAFVGPTFDTDTDTMTALLDRAGQHLSDL